MRGTDPPGYRNFGLASQVASSTRRGHLVLRLRGARTTAVRPKDL
jgi:hypothetical protein